MEFPTCPTMWLKHANCETKLLVMIITFGWLCLFRSGIILGFQVDRHRIVHSSAYSALVSNNWQTPLGIEGATHGGCGSEKREGDQSPMKLGGYSVIDPYRRAKLSLKGHSGRRGLGRENEEEKRFSKGRQHFCTTQTKRTMTVSDKRREFGSVSRAGCGRPLS